MDSSSCWGTTQRVKIMPMMHWAMEDGGNHLLTIVSCRAMSKWEENWTHLEKEGRQASQEEKESTATPVDNLDT